MVPASCRNDGSHYDSSPSPSVARPVLKWFIPAFVAPPLLPMEMPAETCFFSTFFSYVCPEPVLVKRSFLVSNCIAKSAFLYR
jgi:hypothetical protein